MTIDEVTRRIKEIGIIPVVRAATVEEATRAVEAIHAGGIPIAEITLTVPNAVTVIRHLTREYGNEVLIGAGTVTTAQEAEACLAAGAGVHRESRIVGARARSHAGRWEVGNSRCAHADRTHDCARKRREAHKNLSLWKRGRSQVSEVPARPVPRRGSDSNRRSQCGQRRRVHRSPRLCPRSWSGISECRGIA